SAISRSPSRTPRLRRRDAGLAPRRSRWDRPRSRHVWVRARDPVPVAEADRAERAVGTQQLCNHLRLHRRRRLARVPDHETVTLELVVAEQSVPVLEALLGVFFGQPFCERLVGLELDPFGLAGVEWLALGLG